MNDHIILPSPTKVGVLRMSEQNFQLDLEDTMNKTYTCSLTKGSCTGEACLTPDRRKRSRENKLNTKSPYEGSSIHSF